ncbi:MAG TPA: hypothetical protein VKT30_09790, partial [Caulobacteraceae bacterium]|nr:hypothetical protein [Caulobacteraceae bacterium]
MKPLALRIAAGAIAALAALGLSSRASAVPAFAEQTGQPCVGCHVGGFGPQLTPYGREFKLHGYTTRTNSFNVPLSAMAIASYVNTAEGENPPTPGFRSNNNVGLDQFSLFLAGGLGQHFGAFVQTTYDGIGKAWHWDNIDLRAVTNVSIKKVSVLLGLSVNNAPSVQDAFNTLPAWGYPYTTSALSPSPGASPIIGGFAQGTVGLTGYAWIDDSLYLEAGGYVSPGSRLLTQLGVDPTDPGAISGAAPYLRAAYDKNWGDQNLEAGAFWMHANIFPGLDRSTGLTDNYDDWGLDASYQRFAARHDVWSLNARYTHETQDLGASRALGAAANGRNTLQDFRVDGSYYWHDEIGVTVAGFDTWGSADPVLYAGNRTAKPDSSGILVQVDGTPWGRGTSPLG